VLHSGYPVRYWDHDLGPDLPRLYAAEPADADAAGTGPSAPAADDVAVSADEGRTPRGSHALRDLTRDPGPVRTEACTDLSGTGPSAPAADDVAGSADEGRAPRGSHALRDLTRDAGPALTEASTDLAADGSFLVTTWNVPEARGAVRTQLRRVDLADGAQRVL